MIAVVYYLLVLQRSLTSTVSNATLIIESSTIRTKSIEFATFFINGGLFAFKTEHVLEAHSASEISSVSIGSPSERIGVLAIQAEQKESGYAWVYDLSYLLGGIPKTRDGGSQVVVVQHQAHKVGFLVSLLNSATEFDLSQISPSPFLTNSNGLLVKSIIQANEGKVLIKWVDIDYLFKMLSNPFKALSS